MCPHWMYNVHRLIAQLRVAVHAKDVIIHNGPHWMYNVHRLIAQLRVAIHAKDVIIEQVEEEKKELVKETTSQLQAKITALRREVLRLETSAEERSSGDGTGSHAGDGFKPLLAPSLSLVGSQEVGGASEVELRRDLIARDTAIVDLQASLDQQRLGYEVIDSL